MALFKDYMGNVGTNAVPTLQTAWNTPKAPTPTPTTQPRITTQPAPTTTQPVTQLTNTVNWPDMLKRFLNPGTTTPGTTTPTTPTPTPTAPAVNPGEWPVTTPPYAPMPFTGGDQDGILSWLLKSLPDTYAYMNNGLMDTINQSTQLSNQALEGLQTKMNELTDIFNTQGANLLGARDEMMSGMTGADQAFGSILNKYAGYLENGTVPAGIEEALNKIRENSYQNISKRVGKDSNSAIKTALNRFGSSGMIDSDYFKQAMGDIGAKGFSTLSDAGRDIENSYLQSRMAYPFEMFNAVMPQYSSLTDKLKGTAQSAFGSAENTFNDLLKGGLEQANLPIQYFGLAQQLPGWYDKTRTGSLSEIMDLFKTLTEKDIAEKKIQADKDIADDANDWDWTDIFF